jgi:hypothetical protein
MESGAKLEERVWANYIIQPFSRHFFDAISPVQLLASKD